MKSVLFKEENNVYVSDMLTLEQRKKLWLSTSRDDSLYRVLSIQKKRASATSAIITGSRIKRVSPLTAHAENDLLERRIQIQSVVKEIVRNHDSLKSMGSFDSTPSLSKLSRSLSLSSVEAAKLRANRSTRRFSSGVIH